MGKTNPAGSCWLIIEELKPWQGASAGAGYCGLWAVEVGVLPLKTAWVTRRRLQNWPVTG